MSEVGPDARIGWLIEPNCQSCHAGNAINVGTNSIHYTSVFVSSNAVRTPFDQTFAEKRDHQEHLFHGGAKENGSVGLDSCQVCRVWPVVSSVSDGITTTSVTNSETIVIGNPMVANPQRSAGGVQISWPVTTTQAPLEEAPTLNPTPARSGSHERGDYDGRVVVRFGDTW